MTGIPPEDRRSLELWNGLEELTPQARAMLAVMNRAFAAHDALAGETPSGISRKDRETLARLTQPGGMMDMHEALKLAGIARRAVKAYDALAKKAKDSNVTIIRVYDKGNAIAVVFPGGEILFPYCRAEVDLEVGARILWEGSVPWEECTEQHKDHWRGKAKRIADGWGLPTKPGGDNKGANS